jgi:glucose/arabinose dehydrogenase
MLVTERPGNLRIVSAEGKVGPPLSGVPKVWAEGQGGLLDVVLSPEFAKDHTIYLSFAEEAPTARPARRWAVASCRRTGRGWRTSR